jgi:hypothetical protein
MRAFHILALAGCTWLTLGASASADVQISIRDGRVSIAARDATVRQILTEWARVGRTQIVNVERIPGAPMTIELNNVPERDALDMLLRSISGYIAAPRAPFVSDASQFDRIVVMPTSAAPSTAVSSAPPPPFSAQPGNFQPPGPDDEEQRTVVQPARGTIFSTFPQPQVANPRRVAVPSPTPGGEGGPPPPAAQPDPPIPAPPVPGVPQAVPGGAPFGAVAAPGMIAPAPPQQPGQVAPQSVQPRR